MTIEFQRPQIDAYSSNKNLINYIAIGQDNQILNSKSCSIIGGKNNTINLKSNCHVVGDSADKFINLLDDSFNVSCMNGIHCVGDITAFDGSANPVLVSELKKSINELEQDLDLIEQDLTYRTINNRDTSYTLLSTDSSKVVVLDSASEITLTVPSGLGAGFNCTVIQKGTGQVTFSEDSSVTINNRQSHTKIAGQYGVASLYAYTANIFVLTGDTAS